jgi:hypothetical protein
MSFESMTPQFPFQIGLAHGFMDAKRDLVSEPTGTPIDVFQVDAAFGLDLRPGDDARQDPDGAGDQDANAQGFRQIR